jgi:asparagine synthase (glutamine-hydrolysing)
MCGITGFIDFTHNSNLSILSAMTDTLIHRGPDDSGYELIKTDQAMIGLGHRRLSILDLSVLGRQPMEFEQLMLVLNGEIYNFMEIRSELEACGYGFSSTSDTEVVLKAYHKWGVDCVQRFIGMFAFVVYDRQARKLILVRDRAGVKPLYWYFRQGLFLFSSELKSFHCHPGFQKKIDIGVLPMYLKYGYIPEPYAIFKYTRKLKAGHFLKLDLDTRTGEPRETCYWNVLDSYNKPKLDIDEAEAMEETNRLLKSACEYRMVADVPVGMFLSGGYDSSAVTALLQTGRTERLKTFSIGFHEEKHNEAPFARQVAEHLGTDHTEYYCTQKDALDIIPLLPEIWDEPFGDASAIPTTLVSRLARENVTVSLSADGGDEVFGGYGKYTSIRKKLRILDRMPQFSKELIQNGLESSLVHKVAEKYGVLNAAERMNRWATMIHGDEKSLLKLGTTFIQSEIDFLLLHPSRPLSSNFDIDIDQDWLSNILALDYKTYLVDDILTKVDRATMSVSLEGREPLLDHRLVEFVARLPEDYKIRGNDKKWLLKQIVHNYLPKQIMDRPKKGFAVPIFEWFREELKDYLLYYLDELRLREAGIFRPEPIVQLRDGYLAGDQTNITKLWFLLMFEMWREKWG